MEALRLESYLDLLPQSAIVLTWEEQAFSTDSLKVAYVNNVFLEIIEDGHRSEEEPYDVAENFISILQERCINPPLSRFIKWIEGVTQAPESMHHLKTRFKGFTPTTEGPITGSAMQFIDIEWNAVIME